MAETRRTIPRIGLFMRGSSYAYQTEILLGADDEAKRLGLSLYCFFGGAISAPDPSNYLYGLAEATDLDGAILVPGTMGTAAEHPKVQALIERYRGTVLCTIGVQTPGIPSVCVDNTEGVREMTLHLIQAHRRQNIAFICGCGCEADDRLAGYKRALEESGLPVRPELIIPGNFLPEAGREAVSHLLDGDTLRCDAIVAANDWMAIGALQALQERGFRVPDQVALIGFDDVEEASFLTPPLTSIRQSPRQLGATAVAMTGARLAGKSVANDLALPTSAQVRQSCGCFGRASGLRDQRRISQMPPPDSLRSYRTAWVGAVREAGTWLRGHLPDEWAEQLVEHFARDLERGTEDQFLDVLGAQLDRTAHLGNTTTWHYLVGRLRDQSVTVLSGSLSVLLKAESIFGRAHILIGERAERVQGKRRIERETLARNLEDMGVDARTAQDLNALRETLALHLPRLQVSSCYVATGNPSSPESRVLMAYDRHRTLPELPEQFRFRSGELIPELLAPPYRHTVILEALHYKDEVLGFCAFELGLPDSSVFKALSELISTAVKGAQLAAALVQEATRRERAEQARLAQELEIAAKIQIAILPRQQTVAGLQLATVMVPAAEVGGDYFDILPFAGGAWLGIGDVAGHGLHSGLVMLMIQSIVAAATLNKPNSLPSEAWRVLNTVLRQNVRERLLHDEHATFTLIRYKIDGRLVFAGAHEDLLVFRRDSGRVELVRTPGVWAGILTHVPDTAVIDSQLQLDPGDVLLLYTDGVTEAMNASGEVFGIDRLTLALQQLGCEQVEVIRDRIMAEVQAWTSVQSDDVTLVVARYVGDPASVS